jgi:hypothetical protein
MGSLAAEYISYWVDRQGIDRLIEIGRRSKDHDVVRARWVGRHAEQETLRELKRSA